MTTAAGRPSLVEGEFVFTAEDFRHIAQTLHAHAGIALSEGKAALVLSRLAKRLRVLGLRSFRDYCALIEGVEGVDERQAMTAALTTNVTRFYREPHHFDHLREQVMPELAARARAGGRVRLWSAACSNGQEPYSMALTVLDVLPEAADLDVRILATDIDPNMVADGAAGSIPTSCWRGPGVGRKHFAPVAGAPGQFSADATLRRLVAFRELNLIGDWPMRGKFDVIFCRNVVIYFDDATQEMVWAAHPDDEPGRGPLHRPLRAGHGPAAAQLQTCGLTAYQLGGRA